MSLRLPNADGTGRTGRTVRCVVPLRTLLIGWGARTVGRSRSQLLAVARSCSQLLAVALGSLTIAGCHSANGDAADGDPLAAASTTGSSTTAATASAPASFDQIASRCRSPNRNATLMIRSCELCRRSVPWPVAVMNVDPHYLYRERGDAHQNADVRRVYRRLYGLAHRGGAASAGGVDRASL